LDYVIRFTGRDEGAMGVGIGSGIVMGDGLDDRLGDLRSGRPVQKNHRQIVVLPLQRRELFPERREWEHRSIHFTKERNFLRAAIIFYPPGRLYFTIQ